MAIEHVFKLEEFHPNTCKVGKGGMCKACSKISELDAEIQRVQRTLRALVDERETLLKTEINPNHSPALQLPTELVSRIFAFYLGQHRPDKGFPDYWKKADVSAPLTLSAVSKNWREIAFSDPSIWTRPTVLAYSYHKLALQEALLAEWLDRSAGLPLNLSFSEIGYSLNHNHTFVEVVSKVARRLTALHLNLTSSTHSHFLAGLEWHRASKLEDLQLSVVDNCDDHYWPRPMPVPQLPALKTLRMDFYIDLERCTTDLSSIVVCCMGDLHVNDLLEFLQLAPNLQQCKFQYVEIRQGSHAASGVPLKPIRHASIKDLNIHARNAGPINLLFQTLSLPSLQRLVVAHDTGSTDIFTPFLSRSQCPLEELEIYGSSDDEKVIQILRSLPSLSRLSFRQAASSQRPVWMTDSLLQYFTQTDVGLQSALPHLQTLNLAVYGERPFSWEAFITFVESRYTFLAGNNSSSNSRLDICVTHYPAYKQGPSFLESDVARRLANPEWRKYISLKILDHDKGTDLITESLPSGSSEKSCREE